MEFGVASADIWGSWSGVFLGAGRLGAAAVFSEVEDQSSHDVTDCFGSGFSIVVLLLLRVVVVSARSCNPLAVVFCVGLLSFLLPVCYLLLIFLGYLVVVLFAPFLSVFLATLFPHLLEHWVSRSVWLFDF